MTGYIGTEGVNILGRFSSPEDIHRSKLVRYNIKIKPDLNHTISTVDTELRAL